MDRLRTGQIVSGLWMVGRGGKGREGMGWIFASVIDGLNWIA